MRKKKHLARIYIGPDTNPRSSYWTVDVADAAKPVEMNGTALAALRGHPGVTIGCALSRVGMDNAHHFPHPVFFVAVTKSTMLVVDRLDKTGRPIHAVRYGHAYRKIVDWNDTGKLKRLVKAHPEIMERPFLVNPPRKRPTGPHADHVRTSVSGVHRVPARLKGALARAVKAGRISGPTAQQMSLAMSKRRKTNGGTV